MRKPIFQYRLNNEDCSIQDVLEYAFKLQTLEDDFFDPDNEIDIEEAIQIIRANGHTVEYLGI